MVSSFAPGVMLSMAFCIAAWGRLFYKNTLHRLGWFSAACACICLGYIVAIVQYYEIFYISKIPQTDITMYLLFIRTVLHCTGVLIFNYCYDLMPNIKK